ncbi:MAG: hypothetical protein ACC707_11985 [Thiohalomonadales bacterium]
MGEFQLGLVGLQSLLAWVDTLGSVLQSVFQPIAYAISTAANDGNIVLGIDMSIEGLRAQKYSVGIFVFLVISLIFFSGIIYLYVPRKGKEGLKTGEKFMFGSIIAGVFIAVAVGWLELIEGYLI